MKKTKNWKGNYIIENNLIRHWKLFVWTRAANAIIVIMSRFEIMYKQMNVMRRYGKRFSFHFNFY